MIAFTDPRDVLRAHGLWAKKRFGQNFLIAPEMPSRIVMAGGATAQDVVFEIGAGCGTLTRALAEVAGRVIALEHDHDLVPIAQAETDWADNVEVREGNILRVDWQALAEEASQPLVVYGNVPYNLSTDIVVGLLESGPTWSRACFMLQKEFADRITAPPGTRKCGALSAFVALNTWATMAFNVPANSFYPAPKVESAVVILERRPQPAAEVDPKAFRKVVRALFAQRRKMARKALKPICLDAEARLAAAGIDPTRRGETFNLQELAAVAHALYPESPQ